MPASFAGDGNSALVLNEIQQNVPVLTLAQANARQNNTSVLQIPSGVAIQSSGPLSLSRTASLQVGGNPSPAPVSPVMGPVQGAGTSQTPTSVTIVDHSTTPAGWSVYGGAQVAESGGNIVISYPDNPPMNATARLHLDLSRPTSGFSDVQVRINVGLYDPATAGTLQLLGYDFVTPGLGSWLITPVTNVSVAPGEQVVTLHMSSDSTQLTDLEFKVYTNGRVKTVTILSIDYLPRVPEGWTRAASNADFAFRIDTAGGETVLKIMDLTTGTEKEMLRVNAATVMVNPVCDVSPDGLVAVFGMSDASGSTAIVQDLANPAKKKAVAGQLEDVEFLGNALAHLTLAGSGAHWNSYVEYHSMTEQVIYAENAEYTVVGGYQYYLILGSDVVIVPNRSFLHSDVLIGSVKAGQEIFLAFRYSNRSGFVSNIYQAYDISTGQWRYVTQTDYLDAVMASLPSGWTRTASNVNYAYNITSYTNEVGQGFNGLEVLNLLTGDVRKIAEVSADRGGAVFRLVDVAADGSAVIYEKEGMNATGQKAFTIVSLTNAYASVTVGHGRAAILQMEFTANHASVHVGPDIPYRAVGGVYEIDLLKGTYVFLFDVPTGWTRVVSNLNYAYHISESMQLGPLGIMAPVRTLWIMNLLTGESKTVGAAYVSPNYDVFTSQIDVSPNGSLVIFEIASQYTGYHTINIRALTASGFDLTIPTSRMGLGTIEYADQALLFHVGKDETHVFGGVFHLDLATKNVVFVPDVPAGWTRAVSNANYAIRLTKQAPPEQPSVECDVLQVMDLRTGQVVTVANFGVNNEPPIWDHYDVSPEDVPGGAVVFYEFKIPVHTGALSGYDNIIIARRLSDPTQWTPMSERVVLPGAMLRSIEFNAQGQAVVKALMSFSDGTQIESTYMLDLATLTADLPSGKLIQQGKFFAVDADSGYGILITPHNEAVLSNHSILYDITSGTERMKPAVWFVFPDPAADRISFADIYRPDTYSTAGFVFSLSFANADGSIGRTILEDRLDVNRVITFEGWKIEGLRLSGNVMIYQLRNNANETRWTAIDLASFQEVPLPIPAGWTRSAANPHFAYQVSNVSGREVLKVQDLRTGGIVTVYDKPVSAEDLWGTPDISADGKYAVFATRVAGSGSKVYVYDLTSTGPAHEFLTNTGSLVPNAPASPYRFTPQELVVDMVRAETMASVGAYKIDLMTWKGSLALNVPKGWTRTNNANYAYRVSNWGIPRVILYQWLEVMDLTTGKVQRLRTFISGPSWGQVFSGVPVMSADGKSVKINGVTALWGWRWPHFWTETYSLETGKKIG